MKPCSATIVVLCALIFSSASFGEEGSGKVFTTLSSTTVSGYIRTSGHLQRHVCQPVRPVRVHRLYRLSQGVIREIGYTVRCRHGVVYLPNGSIAELLPAPNRSSRFASLGSTPRIDDRTAVFLIDGTALFITEAYRVIQWPPRPVRPLPPVPPLPPPPLRTNWPPIVIQPRPPFTITNRPVRIVPEPPPISTNSPVRIIPGLPPGSTIRVREW
jgi:hypothetical protein